MIVTISREYGAAALDVAHELEHRIGYRVAAEDLPVIAAVRLGAPREAVAAVEGRRPSLIERIVSHLGAVTPETQTAYMPSEDFEAQALKEIEIAVREAAEGGDVIVVGRIANMVLRDRTDLIRAFLHAPLAWRIPRVQASLGVDAERARVEIARYDDARRRYAKVHYDLEWGAVRYYDLAIDVSRFGIAGAADLLAQAVRMAQA